MSNIERLSDPEHEALMRGKSTLDYGKAVESAVHAKLSSPVEVGEAVAWEVKNEDIRYWNVYRDRASACLTMDDLEASGYLDNSLRALYPYSLVERQAREIAWLKDELDEALERLENFSIATGERHNELCDRLSRQGEVIKRAAEAVGQLCNVISADCCDEHGIWSEYEAAVAALDAIRSVEGV